MRTLVWAAMLALLSQAGIAGEASLEDLDWLSGAWIGEEGGTVSQELWMSPRGTVMPGVHRDVSPGGSAFFEYLRIETTADGIVYFASPGGGATTPFRLTRMEGKHVVFENPEHDHPQRILYRLDDSGALHVRIESERGGRTRSHEWVWSRDPAP